MKQYFQYIQLFCLSVLSLSVRAQNTTSATATSARTMSALSNYTVSGSETYPGNISSSAPTKFNFTRVYHPLVPMTHVPSFDSTTGKPILITTTYTDGFDEPLMQIVRNNPDDDVVVPYEYRTRKKDMKYLPFTVNYHSKFINNVHSQQKNYYLNGGFGNGKQAAYSLSTAGSPGRIPTMTRLQAGETNSSYATVATTGLNATGQVAIVTLESGQLCIPGYYNAQQLKSQTVTQSGRKIVTYTNKNGQAVCKMERVGGNAGINGWLVTYFVCDDRGREIAVIPPKLSKELHQSGCLSNIDGKYFSYVYDEDGNLAEKGTPDKTGTEKFVYDAMDRVVLTQTPNLSEANKFHFSIYDKLGRVIMTGLYEEPTEGFSYWQGLFAGGTSVSRGVAAEETLEYWLTQGYNGGDYPDPNNLFGCIPLTVNYYDSYTEDPANGRIFSTAHASHYLTGTTMIAPVEYKNGYGRLVATRNFIQDNGISPSFTENILANVYFYDEQGHVIQMHTLNPWGEWDITSYQYNFAGQKVLEVSEHANGNALNKPTTTIVTKYTYEDKTNWLSKVEQNYDGTGWHTISTYLTHPLGRITEKWLGNAEQQAYSYNIRGELTGINEQVLTGLWGQSDNQSYYSILAYETGFNKVRHDGKLAGYYWRTRGSDIGAYGYEYDSVGRLAYADYHQANASGWSKTVHDYTVSNLSYDENGNIQTMDQRGPTASGPDDMDILTYEYDEGNKLIKVKDEGVNSPSVADFDNANTDDNDDYSYDANGNLTADLNKSIDEITYNFLDKPIQVTGLGNVENIYLPNGQLLQKSIDENNVTTIYHYWGPYVYRNDSLLYILTPEGRARYRSDSSDFRFDFFVRDHQGNVRTVVEEKSEFITVDDWSVTFETVSASIEEAVWDQVGEVRDLSPTLTPQDAMVGRLNSCEADHRIGASILVHAMAGDELNMQGYTYYTDYDPTNTTYAIPETMLSSLTTALTGGAVGGGEEGGGSIATINSLLTTDNYNTYEALKLSATDPNFPRAYLNYLVFDESMNLKPEYSSVIQVRSGANTWDLVNLTTPQVMPITGYILGYFSNESCTDVAVNNVGFTRYWGNLLEEQHYYPHGLTVNAANTTPLLNKYLFESNKYQDEAGLHLYDFNARQYDAQIGRFWGVDPLANSVEQLSWNPYHFCGNDPANFVDPTGMARGWYYGKDHHGKWGWILERAWGEGGTLHVTSSEAYSVGGSGAHGYSSGTGSSSGNSSSSSSILGGGGSFKRIGIPKMSNYYTGRDDHFEKKTKAYLEQMKKQNEEMKQVKLDKLDYKNLDAEKNYDFGYNPAYGPWVPHAMGVTIGLNGNMFVGGSLSLSMGFVNNNFGISLTFAPTFGTPDMGISFQPFMANYVGNGAPTASSYFGGTGNSVSGGLGIIGFGYSQGLNSNGSAVWNTYSAGISGGLADLNPATQLQYQTSPINWSWGWSTGK